MTGIFYLKNEGPPAKEVTDTYECGALWICAEGVWSLTKEREWTKIAGREATFLFYDE